MASEKLKTSCLGSGHPLIILHGWGQDMSALRPLGELLSSSAEVHLIDLPGFGESSKPDSVWGVQEYAESIVEYMNSKGIDKADILGHSFGGRIAIVLASRYPDKVDKVVLMASAGIKRQWPWYKKIHFGMIKIGRDIVKTVDKYFKTKYYEDYFIARHGSIDYKTAGAMRPILVKTINEDLNADSMKIKASTLLLWGDGDDETPLEMGLVLRENIKKSSLKVLKGKGHDLYEGGGAHLCAYHILSFLKEGRR